MSSNEDYDSLCSERDATQEKIDACYARIEDYDYLLGRLKPAKESISTLKSTFKTIRKTDEKLLDDKYKWTGDRYDHFISVEGEEVKGMNNYYFKYSIDYVLDSINDEITRIENLKLDEYGLIGDLGKVLNNLLNKIENFFN